MFCSEAECGCESTLLVREMVMQLVDIRQERFIPVLDGFF